MTETRRSGGDVLAMLEECDVDPDDLPEILQREQMGRWQHLVAELHEQVVREATAGSHDLIADIVDPEILRQLVVMFAASEVLLRDKLEPPTS